MSATYFDRGDVVRLGNGKVEWVIAHRSMPNPGIGFIIWSPMSGIMRDACSADFTYLRTEDPSVIDRGLSRRLREARQSRG